MRFTMPSRVPHALCVTSSLSASSDSSWAMRSKLSVALQVKRLGGLTIFLLSLTRTTIGILNASDPFAQRRNIGTRTRMTPDTTNHARRLRDGIVDRHIASTYHLLELRKLPTFSRHPLRVNLTNISCIPMADKPESLLAEREASAHRDNTNLLIWASPVPLSRASFAISNPFSGVSALPPR